MKRSFSIISLIVFFLGSCALSSPKGDKSTEDLVKGKTWRQVFQQRFEQSTFNEARAMISYSGFENAGQVFVYGNKDVTDAGKVEYVDRSRRNITKTSSISKTKLLGFLESISFANKLNDVETGAMDGIRYTYVHLKKKNGKVEEVKTIKMNNPQLAKPKPKKQLELTEKFYALVRSK